MEKYRDYFDIDPEYFPQVNQELINSRPDLWKKFYPHETFVQLVKDAISVITRKQKVSVWVEGAYGTGKSHAVLTLKKLLEASEEDVKEYFAKYPNALSNDLYNQFMNAKVGEKRLLVVHRYGASSINNDNDLAFAIQESIEKALEENNIENMGKGALRDSTINWLEEEFNKNYFNELITKNYRNDFGGDDVETVIKKLKDYEGDSLLELMSKIAKVASDRKMMALALSIDDICTWIQSIIEENNLRGILFIWDEFTEYFRKNSRSLTGFQKIVDMSSSQPFYMMIVTHDAMHIFPSNDREFGKIKGRFIDPICNIELPDNMAFTLMGESMTITNNSVFAKEWKEDFVPDLYDRTRNSRTLVKKQARITDDQLARVIPIHPYAALMLKNISSVFGSNQRSMFDFIKNDNGDDVKGFQWFIDNYGPLDDDALLTVDMLWGFFYEKGKELLPRDVRTILDYYKSISLDRLMENDKKVLKAILLMSAISKKVGSQVKLFIPNKENIDMVFEGSASSLANGEAGLIADRLVKEKILFNEPIGGGKFQYAAKISAADDSEIEKKKEEYVHKDTRELLQQGGFDDAISFPAVLKQRFNLKIASYSNMKATINSLNHNYDSMEYKIPVVIIFAKDEKESVGITNTIKSFVNDNLKAIIIDASSECLGENNIERYAVAMANAVYYKNKDRQLSSQYERDGLEILKKWKEKVKSGEFVLYTSHNTEGERQPSLSNLISALENYNRKIYPCGLETGPVVIDNMWIAGNLKTAVECAVKGELKGTFRSNNPKISLENYMGEVWKKENYWKTNPYELISKIKNHIEGIIQKAFSEHGRISIREIYQTLTEKPYGFMPTNLTAFVMGFILKEYAVNEYTYSDDSVPDVMSIEKLKLMIDEVIKLQLTPNGRYRDKYIVTITPEMKSFYVNSSKIFDISSNACINLETTRNMIRNKMKSLSFPIRSLKYVLDDLSIVEKDLITNIIDLYTELANNGSSGKVSKTESDIAMSIGDVFIKNASVVEDIKRIMNSDNCKKGMLKYISNYKSGQLIQLANRINDNGQYINCLKDRFDADAANWVWNEETVNEKIDDIIVDYSIVLESNKYIYNTCSLKDCIKEWINTCKNIHTAYDVAKDYYSNLLPLMTLLYYVSKDGKITNAKKKDFLQEVKLNGKSFLDYFNNQIEIFEQCFVNLLTEYNTDQISAIYRKLNYNYLFTQIAYDYRNRVEKVINDYALSLHNNKLKSLWFEKTNTESPRAWSRKYQMPILAMIPSFDESRAAEMFAVIDKTNVSEKQIKEAIEYISKATYIDDFSDENKRTECFINRIVKQYSVLLKDVSEIKKYLLDNVNGHPYDWLSLGDVSKCIEEMARGKYDESGCMQALEKIDNMDAEDVRKYLRELITGHIDVGMAIISD